MRCGDFRGEPVEPGVIRSSLDAAPCFGGGERTLPVRGHRTMSRRARETALRSTSIDPSAPRLEPVWIERSLRLLRTLTSAFRTYRSQEYDSDES